MAFPEILLPVRGEIVLAVKEWQIDEFMVERKGKLLRLCEVNVSVSFSFEARHSGGNHSIRFPPTVQYE